MGTWQDGYVIDVPYGASFFRELSPIYLGMLAAVLGVRAPVAEGREFSYCELGCGRGLGPLLLAAANPDGRFHAYDFNDEQLVQARELAERAGLGNVHFGADTFAALASGSDADSAPASFDLIVLHGVYSWVSAENRAHIVRYLRDRLKPGGMVYVSYNCMPGWAAFTPLQRLLRELAIRRRGRNDENTVAALAFVNQLAARGARYFSADTTVGHFLEHLRTKPSEYLAHEYVNEHWTAFYHLDVAHEMTGAGLEYVGSATVSDNLVGLSAPPEIAVMFAGADAGMAETIKDFSANRKFRCDLFVRDPERLSSQQFQAELAGTRFTLTVDPESATTKLVTAAGELQAIDAVALPVLERLKQGSASAGELAALPALTAVPAEQLTQTLSLLVESGQLHPMRESRKAYRASQVVNDLLIAAAQRNDAVRYLAAPAIGSAVFVAHAEQLVLLALRELGSESVAALRDSVWARLKALSKRLINDGLPLQTEAENVAEVERRIEGFLADRLPLLRRLGVVAT